MEELERKCLFSHNPLFSGSLQVYRGFRKVYFMLKLGPNVILIPSARSSLVDGPAW